MGGCREAGCALVLADIKPVSIHQVKIPQGNPRTVYLIC